jgi:hypothetical protein
MVDEVKNPPALVEEEVVVMGLPATLACQGLDFVGATKDWRILD